MCRSHASGVPDSHGYSGVPRDSWRRERFYDQFGASRDSASNDAHNGKSNDSAISVMLDRVNDRSGVNINYSGGGETQVPCFAFLAQVFIGLGSFGSHDRREENE